MFAFQRGKRALASGGTLAIAALLVASVIWSPVADACTRILWNDNAHAVLTARTMDWSGMTVGGADIYVLPRAMKRDGGSALGQTIVTENPARWTSKHGSVVTTAWKVAAPDGMNERGLGVHALWLEAADYGPRDPGRAGIASTLWSQYVLDNAATVEEAIALQSAIQPVDVTVRDRRIPLGLAIEDASGDSAVLQYIEGSLVVHHGVEYRVVANDPPYDEALELLSQYDFDNATRDTPMPGNTNSHDRFIRASYFLHFLRATEPESKEQAIASLLSVARNVSDPIGAPLHSPNEVGETKLRTVSNLTDLVYYVEPTDRLALLRTDLRRLNFSKGAPVLVLSPDNKALNGNVTREFRPAKILPFSGKRVSP